MDEKTKGILLRCARTYVMLKNWPKALAEYEGLEAEFPDDPFVLEPLALIHQNLGHAPTALVYARKAMAVFNATGHPEKAEKLAQHFAPHDHP
jgi:hypothetical protein